MHVFSAWGGSKRLLQPEDLYRKNFESLQRPIDLKRNDHVYKPWNAFNQSRSEVIEGHTDLHVVVHGIIRVGAEEHDLSNQFRYMKSVPYILQTQQEHWYPYTHPTN